MTADRPRDSSRRTQLSVGLAAAAFVAFTVSFFVPFPRWAVLTVPLAVGVMALVLALSTRNNFGTRPSRSLAIALSAIAALAPIAAFAISGMIATSNPEATYRLTIQSSGPISVVIKDGQTLTEERWPSGRSITLTSRATVVSIGAQATDPTSVLSCEVQREGNTIAIDERAGSVNCGYIAGSD